MDRYKYSVELRYNKQKERISQEIKSEHIRSIIIDRDYMNNNLPVIFMNITLRKDLIDDMIENVKKNTMVLTIYKYIYKEGKMKTKIRYIQEEMMYFIDTDLNYKNSIDYSSDENKTREDLTANLNIGLMGLNSINNNKKNVNTVLRNTTMMNAVYYCIPNKLDMVIERFDYNETMKELLITPQSTVAQSIKYLNNIKVFYKTPYMFFIDFDCGYLLSTSGTSVSKKGETINSVLIIVRDPMNEQAMSEGMITNYDTHNYQIDVSASDTELKENNTTEKLYTSVSSISENGKTKDIDININQSNLSSAKTEVFRTPGSNPNLIQNISAANNQSSSHMTLNKIDVDVSIFTPNKRYIIRNYDGHKDRDGDFILTRKRELFYFDNDDMFTGNAQLEFDQV